jgi:hypothetical protein
VFDPQALCTAVRPTQPDRDIPTLWHVECSWSTKSKDLNQVTSGGIVGTAPGQGGQGEDPLQLPPKVEWTWVAGTKPFTRTPAGEDDEHPSRPVKNSAGQVFSPIPEIDDPRLTLRVTRAKQSFDRAQAFEYMNTINSDPFQGFEPRQARIVDYSGELDFHKNRRFFWVRQAFVFRKPDWDYDLLDQGDYFLAPQQDTIVRFTDAAGNPRKGQLDGQGLELDRRTDADVYLLFNAYRSRPFAALGIPPL